MKALNCQFGATYVVDREGTVIRAFADADYTKRLDPEEMIAVLKELEN